MEAAVPPLTSPSKVSKQSITKAVKALLKWKKSTQPKTKTKTLNPETEFLYLTLTLTNPPLRKTRPPISTSPHTIPLPNPIISPHSPNFNICLIVKDKFSQSAMQKIESELIPISNVIKLSKFKSDFVSFEEKKELCDSYDAFLADKGLVPELPGVIGRYFYKRRKGPVAVELGRSDWKEQIERVFGLARVVFKEGSCGVVVKVAAEALGREKIVENVAAAVDGIVEVVPKKWRNVRALHLKFGESLALPIYGGGVGGGEGEVGVSGLEGLDGEGIVGKKRKIGVDKVAKVKQDDFFM